MKFMNAFNFIKELNIIENIVKNKPRLEPDKNYFQD